SGKREAHIVSVAPARQLEGRVRQRWRTELLARNQGRMILLAGDGGIFSWRLTLSRETTSSVPSPCLRRSDLGPMYRIVNSCFPSPKSLRVTRSPGRGSGEKRRRFGMVTPLPNEVPLSCGLRPPQTRLKSSAGGGGRRPTASRAG